MRIPAVRGIIDRRILVNYRVDPRVLAEILPAPFRPKLVHGFGIAGICLIRLKNLRPRFVPSFAGLTSENAAHRIAVEWDDDRGQVREGVFIPRRDTSFWFNVVVGGRLFPGVHHCACFHVNESEGQYSVALDSDDRETHVAVSGQTTDQLATSSIFRETAEASKFFACGAAGYSPSYKTSQLEGLELRTNNWKITPLAIDTVESSYFENRSIFPAGSIEFDSAFLMRNIEHEWRQLPTIQTTGTARARQHKVPTDALASCVEY